jgi:hypothetical protein
MISGEILSPPGEPRLSCLHLVHLRALREACVGAGRGAAPAGLVATRHPGGTGAPPGTTRSPRQELARSEPARCRYRQAGSAAVNAANSMRSRLRCEGGFFECAIASLLERVWRAERRPRAARHELSALRFSARHPLMRGGRFYKVRTWLASRKGARMSVAMRQTPRSPLVGEHTRHLARGEGRRAAPRQKDHPSPFPPFVALGAPGGKPSPTGGEG